MFSPAFSTVSIRRSLLLRARVRPSVLLFPADRDGVAQSSLASFRHNIGTSMTRYLHPNSTTVGTTGTVECVCVSVRALRRDSTRLSPVTSHRGSWPQTGYHLRCPKPDAPSWTFGSLARVVPRGHRADSCGRSVGRSVVHGVQGAARGRTEKLFAALPSRKRTLVHIRIRGSHGARITARTQARSRPHGSCATRHGLPFQGRDGKRDGPRRAAEEEEVEIELVHAGAEPLLILGSSSRSCSWLARGASRSPSWGLATTVDSITKSPTASAIPCYSTRSFRKGTKPSC